ncbi:MAG: hypothetical protein HY689_06900 [Chloroflexi bacterium]|nr:hypothetical protein [Chloroflexota bacterium]
MLMTLMVVPTRDHAQRPFSPQDFRALEERLRTFGGFQVIHGVYGEWATPEGRVYPDESRIYRTELPVQRLPEWLAVVAWARRHFRQEEMWVEIHGQGTVRGP